MGWKIQVRDCMEIFRKGGRLCICSEFSLKFNKNGKNLWLNRITMNNFGICYVPVIVATADCTPNNQFGLFRN